MITAETDVGKTPGGLQQDNTTEKRHKEQCAHIDELVRLFPRLLRKKEGATFPTTPARSATARVPAECEAQATETMRR